MQGTTTPNGPVGLPASRPAVPAHSQPSSSPTPRPASSACDPPAEGAPSLSSAGGVPGEARSRRPGSPALTGREPAGWAALFWELPQGWRSRERPHGASPGFPPPRRWVAVSGRGEPKAEGAAAAPPSLTQGGTHSLTHLRRHVSDRPAPTARGKGRAAGAGGGPGGALRAEATGEAAADGAGAGAGYSERDSAASGRAGSSPTAVAESSVLRPAHVWFSVYLSSF